YKATGINLKSMPLSETDRLVTILTREYGLIRAVAPGARKHHSRFGGRSELFVVNELLIAKGRSLDKITQAETVESYPGLAKQLSKLAASQYLAEMVLYLALSDQPQEELYSVFNEHLRRLEQVPIGHGASDRSLTNIIACLCHGIFHLLAVGGIAPQVHSCCLTKEPLIPRLDSSNFQVGFSFAAGGLLELQALPSKDNNSTSLTSLPLRLRSGEPPKVNFKLTGVELSLLQQLTKKDLNDLFLIPEADSHNDRAWLGVERSLREYAQYHLNRPIRSAMLVESCFSTFNSPVEKSL
ncbi:DNA repair protein RecO, partial [Merismopedia glauca]